MSWWAGKVTVLLLGCAAGFAACAGEQRRPEVAPSEHVTELRLKSGPIVQDCGEAEELREDQACAVRPIGECVTAALKDCRVAHGVRRYFMPEGDAVRVDWLVLKNDHGTCDLVMIEDTSADPLSKQPLRKKVCRTVEWKIHPDVDDCLLPVPLDCREVDVPQPNRGRTTSDTRAQ